MRSATPLFHTIRCIQAPLRAALLACGSYTSHPIFTDPSPPCSRAVVVISFLVPYSFISNFDAFSTGCTVRTNFSCHVPYGPFPCSILKRPIVRSAICVSPWACLHFFCLPQPWHCISLQLSTLNLLVFIETSSWQRNYRKPSCRIWSRP